MVLGIVVCVGSHGSVLFVICPLQRVRYLSSADVGRSARRWRRSAFKMVSVLLSSMLSIRVCLGPKRSVFGA